MDRSRNGFHFTRYFTLAFLVLALFGMFGCRMVSNFRHVYSDMALSWQHPNDNFKRKVALLVRTSPSFKPPAGMDTNLGSVFSKALYAALPDKCKRVFMINSDEIKLPGNDGTFDPKTIFSLCQSARQVGCNTVVCCDLVSFNPVTPKSKFARFTSLFSSSSAKEAPGKQHHTYQIVADVFAYNTLTGAWVYHDRLKYQYNAAKTDIADMKPGPDVVDAAVRKAFDVMADRAAEGLCPAISNQIWAGFGIAATHDTITIHSGSDVGLSTGTALDAWSAGEVVKSVNGAKYWLPGHKTGEVKLVKVSAHKATGKLVSGSIDGVGSVLLYQGALP